MTREEIIDGLEIYTVGRLKKDRVHITVGELQEFINEIKALEQEPKTGWIPVSERLPKRNGYYLVTGRKGAVNKRLYQDGHWCGNWAILAWTPLPSPYDPQESEE